jgi:hypothetical protein
MGMELVSEKYLLPKLDVVDSADSNFACLLLYVPFGFVVGMGGFPGTSLLQRFVVVAMFCIAMVPVNPLVPSW